MSEQQPPSKENPFKSPETVSLPPADGLPMSRNVSASAKFVISLASLICSCLIAILIVMGPLFYSLSQVDPQGTPIHTLSEATMILLMIVAALLAIAIRATLGLIARKLLKSF